MAGNPFVERDFPHALTVMFLAVLLPPAVRLVGLGFSVVGAGPYSAGVKRGGSPRSRSRSGHAIAGAISDRIGAPVRWRCDSRRRPRNHHLFKDCTGPAGRTHALDTIKTGIAGSGSSTIRRRRESRISRHAGIRQPQVPGCRINGLAFIPLSR